MSAVMAASYAVGPVRPAPELITEAVLHPFGTPSRPVEQGAALVAHVAYGTANGILFSVAARHLPGGQVRKGVAFGLALLLLSYEGWVPVAGILPPLHAQKPHRFRTLAAAHLVYGAVLGWATR